MLKIELPCPRKRPKHVIISKNNFSLFFPVGLDQLSTILKSIQREQTLYILLLLQFVNQNISFKFDKW